MMLCRNGRWKNWASRPHMMMHADCKYWLGEELGCTRRLA